MRRHLVGREVTTSKSSKKLWGWCVLPGSKLLGWEQTTLFWIRFEFYPSRGPAAFLPDPDPAVESNQSGKLNLTASIMRTFTSKKWWPIDGQFKNCRACWTTDDPSSSPSWLSGSSVRWKKGINFGDSLNWRSRTVLLFCFLYIGHLDIKSHFAYIYIYTVICICMYFKYVWYPVSVQLLKYAVSNIVTNLNCDGRNSRVCSGSRSSFMISPSSFLSHSVWWCLISKSVL